MLRLPRCKAFLLVILALMPAPLYSEEINLRENLYALVIGASRYRYWDSLTGVREDVKDVSNILENMGFFVHPVDDPNRSHMIQEMRNFVSTYGQNPHHLLLIYYAGHGDTLNGEGFLVPADAPRKPVGELSEEVRRTYMEKVVSMDWIREMNNTMQAHHAIFLFDSCFSGSLFRALYRGALIRTTRKLPPSISQLLAHPTRLFITAGDEDQPVPDQSVFRKFFRTGLSGGADLNKDGYITGQELAMFIRDNVSDDSRGKQTPLVGRQLPNGEHDKDMGYIKGDVVFLSPIGQQKERVTVDTSEPPEMPIVKEPRIPGEPFVDNDLDHPERKPNPIFPRMMPLEPGTFDMGTTADESAERGEDEDDQTDSGGHVVKVSITKPFAISVGEVTFDQWDRCFQEGGCQRWPDDEAWGRGMRPVIHVSWDDTRQYLAWLTRKTGFVYRLPSEAEWEYAARAGMQTARPWGNDLGTGKANCRSCGNLEAGRKTTPTGNFPGNRFGLYDMLGNVWEWVQDGYRPQLGQSPVHGADNRENHLQRVIRGGSFATSAKGVRSAARAHYPGNRHTDNIGFRVVRDITLAEHLPTPSKTGNSPIR